MMDIHRSFCSKKCPRGCEEITYDTQVSAASLGNKMIFKTLAKKKNISFSESREYVR